MIMNIRKFALVAMTLSAMGFSSMNAQTAASAVDGKKQTIYLSANHASTPYRIPAVATLNNGTVLAIADHRPCGADIGNGEVDLYAKVGTIAANGSYSWNPSAIDPSVSGGLKIADGDSSNGYGDAAVVVDRESGKVLVICVSGKVVFSKGSSSKHNKMARIVGSADGLSWETPQDVTTAFFDNLLPSAYTMFMASGRMIQSQHVKVGNYYRIYGVLLVREKSGWFSKSNNNYVVYSDDFGASWKVLGGSYCLKGGDEAKVEELPNGDLVMSSRTSGGRYFNVFKFTDLNSASGSWGSATKYSFGGSNSTNGELMLYKGLVDANGTEYNVMLQSLPTGSSRSNVAVFYKAFATSKTSWAVSDFTSGWTKGIEVDNGLSAYSTMTILPNGQVGFLYEDGNDTSNADADYFNIVYVPLTVEEITGGAFSAPATGEPEAPAVAVETPAFSIVGGEVEEGTTVTISCATEGATIYYTTDGTEPTTSSAVYSGAITVNSAMTIKAMAAKEGNYTDSEVASATFTIKAREVVATPVISPAGGEVEEGTTVTISCATSGATVYYTTDGTTPTTSSAVYSGAITVNSAMTVKAMAAKNGYYTNSAVATATFTIKEVVVEPEIPVEPEEPEEPETPVIDEALQQAIVAAQEVAACAGVGYPSSSAATRVALDNAIANAQAGNATASDLENAVSAFKNEVNDIQMPEDGVTYKFVNVAQNGTKYYIKYASSGISMVTDESQATEYTCEAIGGDEYAFVTSDGRYLIWKGPNGSEGFLFWKKTYGYNSNKGYVTSYNSTYCDLVVEKLTNGGNVSASSNADLFGMMAIQGMRYSRSEYGYFTIKSDGTFDASSDPYYNSSYSSAFYIVATGTAAKGSRIEGTTAVEEVTVERVADDAIYDLTGRKVTEMRAGEIYIQNGKKILKR